jgi:hypothetical protein
VTVQVLHRVKELISPHVTEEERELSSSTLNHKKGQKGSPPKRALWRKGKGTYSRLQILQMQKVLLLLLMRV